MQGIEVIYVVQNMSGAYINQLLKYIVDKRVYVNVISKSGGTMEPALAFRTMRQYMEAKYGEDAVRFSVLTPVGLLPVADIDIRALLAGAKQAAEELANPNL